MAEENLKWPGDQCPPDCAYTMRFSTAGDGIIHRHCGYILKAGQMRGCEPGPGCTRYQGGGAATPAAMSVKAPKARVPRPAPIKRKPRLPQWDTRKGYELYRQGLSTGRIAEVMGVGLYAVQYYRQKYWNHGKLGPREETEKEEIQDG